MAQFSRIALTCLILLGFAAPAADAGPHPLAELETELWYVVMLGEQKAGHLHTRFTVDEAGGTAETRTTTRIRVKRGEASIDIEQDSSMTETLDGRPVRGSNRVKLGLFGVDQSFDYGDEAIVVTSRQLGGEQVIELPPVEEGVLTPGQAGLRFAAAEAAGDDELSMRVIDPAAGPQPIEMGFTRVGEEGVEVFGKTVPATAWDVTTSLTPRPMRQHLDEHGQPVRVQMDVMPGMTFRVLLADAAIATAEVDPPELLARTLIQPKKRLAAPRDAARVVYELSLRPDAGVARVNLPQTGHQRVEPQAPGRWDVTVDVRDTVPEPAPPLAGYLASSAMINHDHPSVVALAASVPLPVGGLDGPARRREHAEALRRFVNLYLDQKDLSVGMATASETVQTRQGDCTEHAVLLTALLRRAGIPARTATGLIYVERFLDREHVMGYHMWSQAWIDAGDGVGYWQDLDASLEAAPGPRRLDGPLPGFDAAHITLRTSDFDDPSLTRDLLETARLIGVFDVKILEAE